MNAASTNIATIPKKSSLTSKFAERFSIDESKVMVILKSTAFKQKDNQPPASDEQMTALMIVADQYGLNPFTKEIYAYPDKGGIVPVVGVDGWSRIMNSHPQMDGIEFRYSDETTMHKGKTCHVWIECIITRKDRSKPTVVREYFDEVVRTLNFSTPWDTHPKRLHRHKAEIQCARVAFGFAGIYDEDEAQRIIEVDIQTGRPATPNHNERPALEYCSDEEFIKMVNDTVHPETGEVIKMRWKSGIQSGRTTAESAIQTIQTRTLLTDEQIKEIESWENINA
jgi:phage recombination protein Bet